MPSQLDRIARRVEDQARRRALELRRRNATATDIAQAMARIVSDAGMPDLWAAATLSEAERTYQWVADRTLPDAERRVVAGVVQRSATQFALVAAGLQRAVADAATRAIREGLPASELESLLANKFGKAEAHARTIARTALGAFDRADTVRQAEQAGVQKFRYVGPPASRDFCQHHLAASRRKTYTLEEIKKLNNGQGLPVLYYGGGWNCRHTWEAVVERKDYLAQRLLMHQKGGFRVHHRAVAADSGAPIGYVVATPLWEQREGPATRDGELRTAILLADAGHEVELDDATTQDALVDGKASEFKASKSAHNRTLERKLQEAKHQSSAVYIRLTQPIPEWGRAKEKAGRWLQGHSGRQLFIIHEYETPVRIEEIMPW